jgi:nicotinamidase-related amidase
VSVVDVIDALERAPRQGAAVDDPEGTRYVVISETALNRIIRELQLGTAERPGAEYFGSAK